MSVNLKEIPVGDLPRERLLSCGAESLSNQELLAILIRTGTVGHVVTDVSREILSQFKSIRDLKNINIENLKKIKGLGDAKCVTILAALELGKRVYEEKSPDKKIRINNSIDVYRYFSKYIVNESQENFMAVFLDNHKRYISHKILFKGTLNASLVHPREVFKMAILDNASGVVIMHNHPSGVTKPSKADDDTTRTLSEAGNMMGIPVLDHLIVAEDGYYSYVEEGRLVNA